MGEGEGEGDGCGLGWGLGCELGGGEDDGGADGSEVRPFDDRDGEPEDGCPPEPEPPPPPPPKSKLAGAAAWRTAPGGVRSIGPAPSPSISTGSRFG